MMNLFLDQWANIFCFFWAKILLVQKLKIKDLKYFLRLSRH